MPKLSIDDVKRMMTNAAVKANRYNEAASYLRNDRTPDNMPTNTFYSLKNEAQRMEGIATGLTLVIRKMEGAAKADALAHAGAWVPKNNRK